MDDNELLKKDLIFILCASEKFDLTKDEYVRKLNLLLKRRTDINTILGKTYRERLLDIEEGKIAENCFICNKNHATDRVICSSCMKKYSGGKKHIFSEIALTDEAGTIAASNAPTNTVEASNAKTNTAETSNVEATPVEATPIEATPIEESVANPPAQPATQAIDDKEKEISIEEIKTATVEPKAKSQQKSKESGFFGKELSGRYRIIVAIFAVLILITAVAGANGRNINANGVPVNNGETYVASSGLELNYYEQPSGEVGSDEAERILRAIFPKSDGFEVAYAQSGRTFQFWFWGPLGRTTDVSEMIVEESDDTNLRNLAYSVENVYYFSIISDRYNGLAIVNSDGRVVAQGTLPGFPDHTNIYRIR